ncbi:SseB family protein [Microlunatus speluncae]|uniref:SseB family protein n=1 Tax=Microlunatus speluncae TaxID=2594267 RepID=UPI0012662EAD|nr:SseB family protein [Microlunatus speluncae]
MHHGPDDHERRLAPSPFPGDDGRATPETRAALAAVDGGDPVTYLRAVAVLCGDRILVPVVATATSTGTGATGLVSDKEAEMSVVLLQAADGRRAMLGFTGTDALTAWDPAARPVPITLDQAAEAAVADHADALLIDHAGPAPFVIDGEVLRQLAGGHRLVDLGDGEFGWATAVGG